MSCNFLSELKHNNYYEVFNIYADLSDKFLTQAKTDKPYDKGNIPKKPISIFWIPIVIGIGMLIARFIVKGMENQLETVRPALAANSYIKENSLNITRSEDQFLYNTVNKTAKQKEKSKIFVVLFAKSNTLFFTLKTVFLETYKLHIPSSIM